MVNCMRNILGHLLGMEQGAFLPDRVIKEQILIAHELVNSLVRHNGSSILLKLDLLKAYDWVNWTFMECSMEEYGFVNIWKWVISFLVKGNLDKETPSHSTCHHAGGYAY
ncbi:hypothetical protein EJ110_NYTH58135 [Nymphaea thermarum]|nr:hypothetical protein EJ110_NYTH58135 [Nymphaea thermarum]